MALQVARPFHPPPRRCTRAHSVSPSTETCARPVLQEALHISPGGPQWSWRRPPGDACPRRRRRLCHLPRMCSTVQCYTGRCPRRFTWRDTPLTGSQKALGFNPSIKTR